MQPSPRPAVVRTPATVGNFGPGFDAFALALHGLGDVVEVGRSRTDRLEVTGRCADGVPTAWDRNTATVAVDRLRETTGRTGPLAVRIDKRIPPGSGLGSSAASAGGAALAFAALHRDLDLDAGALVEAAAAGEEASSGRHHDDVAAVVLGGLAITRVADGRVHLARVDPPPDLHVAIVVPELTRTTREMRALVPERVDRAAAVGNLQRSAALVAAFQRGDVAEVGACLEDGIAAPHRTRGIVFYDDVREAARRAGAFGATLSGSGPAVVAVTDAPERAEVVAEAMREAVVDHGTAARSLVARPEREVMHRAAAMH